MLEAKTTAESEQTTRPRLYYVDPVTCHVRVHEDCMPKAHNPIRTGAGYHGYEVSNTMLHEDPRRALLEMIQLLAAAMHVCGHQREIGLWFEDDEIDRTILACKIEHCARQLGQLLDRRFGHKEQQHEK